MTCDHVVPKSAWPLGQRHLADDPGNLRTLCQRCNSKKSSRSIEQFMSNRTFHY
jgi:5-methylcytosine-specific restriction endonuclease McrA